MVKKSDLRNVILKVLRSIMAREAGFKEKLNKAVKKVVGAYSRIFS